MKPLSTKDKQVVMTIIFGSLLGLCGAIFGTAIVEALTVAGLIDPPAPSWNSALGRFCIAVLGWLIAARIFWLWLRGRRDREST